MLLKGTENTFSASKKNVISVGMKLVEEMSQLSTDPDKKGARAIITPPYAPSTHLSHTSKAGRTKGTRDGLGEKVGEKHATAEGKGVELRHEKTHEELDGKKKVDGKKKSVAPSVSCDGFTAVYGCDPQAAGTIQNLKGAKPCNVLIGANEAGYCRCSDQIPRFLKCNHPLITCSDMCQPLKNMTSDLDPISEGSDGTGKMSVIQSGEFAQLYLYGLAISLISTGISLLIYHKVAAKTKTYTIADLQALYKDES
jgi:hypothetical protein